MIVCRQCQREIPEINQGKFCPFCGAVLGEEDAAAASSAAATLSTTTEPSADLPPSGDATQGEQSLGRESVPWEERERVGFLQAFSQTWSDATFRPAQFFRSAPKTGNLGSSLLFAFIIGMVATLISSFWQYQFWDSFSNFSETPELQGFESLLGMTWNRDMLRFFVLGSPLWVVVLLFLRAAILHVFMIILGGNRHGWDASFRAVSYSSGPQLFAIVPWCGDVIAFFWQIVLVIIGLRELHETTTGRAAWAVFLPFVLCCCSLSLLAYRLAGWFSRLGTQI